MHSGHGILFPKGKSGFLSKEGHPLYLTNRKMVLYWSNPGAIFLAAKIKTFTVQSGSRTASLLPSRSHDLPGGVMSHLLRAAAWGNLPAQQMVMLREYPPFGALNQSNSLQSSQFFKAYKELEEKRRAQDQYGPRHGGGECGCLLSFQTLGSIQTFLLSEKSLSVFKERRRKVTVDFRYLTDFIEAVRS